MCGIVGYLGKDCNLEKLIQKLKLLEYRGYDSAGISFDDKGKFVCCKAVGKIAKLESQIPKNVNTTNAILHTRWATNGAPVKENAHPHVSHSGEWTIVHNGIFEDIEIIKSNLKFAPKSETDTAIIAEFLEERSAKDIFDFADVINSIKGSYAIVAQNKKLKNALFLAKNKSPLYVAENDGSFLVASDPICFENFSKTYFDFKDGEFAEIQNGKVKFFNSGKKEIKKIKKTLDTNFEKASKNGYPHYMLKEILEQPSCLKRQVQYYKSNCTLDAFENSFLQNFSKVVFVGCGTAYHAGLMGAKYFAKIAGVEARCEIASELITSNPVFADEKTLFIFISQSGETADVLSALDLAKRKKATSIAVTNVAYSVLAQRSDYVLPVCAGPEIAVASTKAYVCQLSALYLLASKFAGRKLDLCYKEIEDLADGLLDFDEIQLKDIAKILAKQNSCIFIGKDMDYITACESSLKLKEIAYINSNNYPSGELKHGFLALVGKDLPVFVFATNKKINLKTMNASAEAKARGARLIYFTNETKILNDDFIIKIKEDELMASIKTVVPAQMLAYFVSVEKGLNPDQPRNLAKSVTVE